MIGIIDLGISNTQSVANALAKLKTEFRLVKQPEDLASVDKIILPGVGSFAAGMNKLNQDWQQAIQKEINQGKPLLGICLGMQLLFEESQESPGVKGLGLFKGKVKRFEARKVPQIGWNSLEINESKLFQGIDDGAMVYFVNGYYAQPENKEIIASQTTYSQKFCSALESKNIFAVQFHPEKSGSVGLRILKNFLEVKA